MTGTWGVELWDQYSNLSEHTQKGLDFLERFGHFVKERCSIEMEYAKKLRNLCKNYQPKKKDEEDYQFTHTQAFLQMTKEMQDLAGQHEVIAETFDTDIFHRLIVLMKEIKEERKKYLNEGQRLNNNLTLSGQQLDKSKRNCEKAYREAVRAEQNYKKADADYNLSRAEVDKAKIIAQQRNQQNEESKTDYANLLENYNRLKDKLFNEDLPRVFNNLQEMDEKRINNIHSYIKQVVEAERRVFPIINTCLDGILHAADQIDAKKDSAMVIERYKSGFEPPKDIEFENFNETLKYDDQTNTLVPIKPGRSPSIREPTIGSIKPKKHKNTYKPSIINTIFGKGKPDDIKEDYSDLPPNQQRKKLEQKIEQIRQMIQQENAAREGMIKMKSVYQQNPQMGDPASLEPQLQECGKKLESLMTEQTKFQQYMYNCENRLTPNTQKRVHRNSDGADSKSLSRSSSGSTMENGQHNGHHHVTNSQSDSSTTSSGVGGGTAANNYDVIETTSSHSAHSTHSDHSDDNTPNTLHTQSPDPDYGVSLGSEFDDEVLGTCRALYPFDAQNEGAIRMEEGEEFDILEQDQGDGWTRVRRRDGAQQDPGQDDGFVPTSYIECFYNTNQV